ncbi:lactate utilization protein B [Acerihabitans sp. TG2]|uniref:lactate utilization protein B n=1 Tax=Acerihabitans sp. TG2 TaxID=3096008 RepID=UPI002B222087|nr:lactate utilization protein B [Acerihabitans sp. TG2]MEA9393517.1 lactate utilization protein B [Acerihabitans sp. TG2]
MKAIDHVKGSRTFLASPKHQTFLDQRLWSLRMARDAQMKAHPEWQQLRTLASDIKEHTLTHLDHYLRMFERNAQANGVQVHWAKDAEAHNRLVHEILSTRQVKTLVKSKSMLTEECDMRPYLEARGIAVIETDLGERIQQLDNEMPSHIVVPAVHKLSSDVARVFAQTLGTDPNNADPHYLAGQQRDKTRPLILQAEAGMTGCNFAVAQTGTVTVCTNEGNADLSANVPDLHLVSIGIEKIIPRMEDLGVFIRLLSRSALGSPITQYTSHFRAPRQGGQMHFILVDNGRSERLGMEDFWYSLKCIRCSACMNTCPVYRRSGGISYGAVYSGPIGAIINPTMDLKKYSTLPFASTLNGSCTSVCPVRINIHEQIFKWREIVARNNELPFAKKSAMKAAGKILANPTLYRAVVDTANAVVPKLPRILLYNPLNAWGESREIPDSPRQSFHRWYEARQKARAAASDTTGETSAKNKRQKR